MRTRSALAISMAATFAGMVVLYGWHAESETPVDRDQARTDPPTLADLHLELPRLKPTEWVELYRPETSSPGYNLVLYQRRLPMLIDANGRIAHAWPQVRAVGRARLDRKCRLAVIGQRNRLEEYDWESTPTWSFKLPDSQDLLHHDFAQLRNGNYLALARDAQLGSDYLLEIDRSGQVLWKWHSSEHLDAHFPDRDRGSRDPTHINSVRELPENPWFESGDERFRPGNLLLSARHLNTVFVVDRASGDIVWKYDRGLDYQHEAVMIGQERDDAGLVVVFNNGFQNREAYRRSEVLLLDPVEKREVWSYRSDEFFSAVSGTAQPLPNGNLLITSSSGGRVFELTRSGTIVWQWVPPYLPMRVSRYPADHCPELAQLDSGPRQAVAPRSERPFIDEDLYTFCYTNELRRRSILGREIEALKDPSECRLLRIPSDATLTLSYGVDTSRLAGETVRGRFRTTLRPAGANEARILVDEQLDSSAESRPWRTRTFSLADLAYERAELCLELEAPGEIRGRPAKRFFAWENPLVTSSDRPWRQRRAPAASAQERKFEERLLEALGYAQ